MTTVSEAVESIARKLNLANFSTFGLFHIASSSLDEDSDEKEDETFSCLDDDDYVLDVVPKSDSNDDGSNLIFKKKQFVEQDENIEEPTFVTLCFAQARLEFIGGTILSMKTLLHNYVPCRFTQKSNLD